MKNADMPAAPAQVSINRDRNEFVPHQFGNDDFVNPGMTKREHFAAMAMQGFCAFHGDGQGFDVTARESVAIADALLAELEKTK